MRMRRKAWARPELAACDFFIDEPKKQKGRWHQTFKKQQPIHLELGCGKGWFICQIGRQNPSINYIAVDVKSDVLGYAKRNIETVYGNEQVENILLFAYDIETILEVLDEQDKIDRIYINFCNPWPKNQHKKRRLTHTRQLEKYKHFLKQNGEIYFKTDDEALFKDSIRYLEESGFLITKSTYHLHNEADQKENIITEHEKMFTEQGISIKALVARRVN